MKAKLILIVGLFCLMGRHAFSQELKGSYLIPLDKIDEKFIFENQFSSGDKIAGTLKDAYLVIECETRDLRLQVKDREGKIQNIESNAGVEIVLRLDDISVYADRYAKYRYYFFIKR
jgi:hypothetical protein